MTNEATSIRTSGTAFRVIVLAGQHAIAYRNVQVKLDPSAGLLHLLDEGGTRHYLSAPMTLCIVEWSDPAALEPEPFMPVFASGAYERMLQQIAQMTGNIGREPPEE